MNCRQCHNNIPDQAVFCPFCGQACSPQQPPQPPQPPLGAVPPADQRQSGRCRPKWLFILIGAFSVLVVAGVLLLVLRPESKDQNRTSPAESVIGKPARIREADTDPSVHPERKAGAVRFSGKSSDFTDIETLELNFVLSEDRSNIHDVAIQVTNLQGKVRKGSTEISTQVSRATEYFTQSYPVKVDGDTENIQLGQSQIKRLRFENGKAYALLHYIYKSSSTSAIGSDFEISFGEEEIILTPDPMYGGAPLLRASDFDGYRDFVEH